MTGDDIRALREDLGWTQEQMAQRLGVSFTTVNRWERGQFAPSPLAERELRRLREEQAAPD